MTFTVLAYCRDTQKMGFCQATSTPAVGWRCTDVVLGRGLVTVQAHGDYRQLQLAKRLMEFGHSPAKVMKDLSEDDKHFDFRQIAIMDLNGNSAVNTGSRARPWAGEIVGDNYIVTGNVLVGEKVIRAMSKAFQSTAGQELEERLLHAVEAGRDAGGQEEGQTSCALTVYERHTFPIVNLRVDVALEPIGEMRKILDWYKPLIPYYVSRTLDPTSVAPKKATLERMGLPVNPYAA
ncbi:MAG: DUF1028 domain-containing protein [Pseudomonadota bacterium]|nr:DUF1028 domain-containing protein [Pseudomonadota bacterium]